MIKGTYTLIGNPSALFQTIIDTMLPLSIGPIEVTYLLLFVVAVFLGIIYSKRVHKCIDYLVGQKIG